MKKKTGKIRRRIIALLSREEMEFLEQLSMDSLFSTGSKLTRVDIIAALVGIAMRLNISANGVRNKEELVEAVLNKLGIKSERRQYPRIKKDLIVEFRKMDSLKNYNNAQSINMGFGGIRIDTGLAKSSLTVNQLIEISIKDSREDSSPIKAIGRVLWIKKKASAKGYEAGIMLTYVRKEDRKKFTGYLNEEPATPEDTDIREANKREDR